MTEKEAREITKRIDGNSHELAQAQGYLEALEKAKVLEEALRLSACKCSPANDLTCERCKALAKWEKEK